MKQIKIVRTRVNEGYSCFVKNDEDWVKSAQLEVDLGKIEDVCG